ncbi:WD40-repeat-containing domain protein [Tirmania nivea]|nr:WD40-repeat-containing domain protein [Tirmania nivea]
MTFKNDLTQNYREESGDNVSSNKLPYTLAATTGDVYCGSVSETNAREELSTAGKKAAEESNVPVRKRRTWWDGEESNCFRSAQWTADGRYLVTNSEDSGVRVFGLPSEWSESDEVDPNYIPQLKPYAVIHEPESVYSIGTCPWILDDPNMNWFITCVRDNPLHLYALTGKVLSTFVLQNANTEQFLSPHSIIFSRQEPHFICGTESMISVFDLNRREPLTNLRTIPSRKHTSSTQTMKGIISAMDISPDSGVLAAGTLTRSVGLYDQEGSGEVVSIFSVAEEGEQTANSLKGVTDIRWSSCGTYLYVAERKSEKITVWDVRKLFGKVATLTGREASTVQRMGIDVFLGEGERDMVVAGGLDGKIKMWDVHGDTCSVGQWEAHNDPVSAVAVNPAWPGLIASCSGQRNHSRGFSHDDDRPWNIDNTLKLWKYAGKIASHLDAEPADFGPYPLPNEMVPDIDR